MPQRVVFLDTSFVVALVNSRDAFHERAIDWDDRLIAENAELVLHWGILLEIGDGFARLGRREKGSIPCRPTPERARLSYASARSAVA